MRQAQGEVATKAANHLSARLPRNAIPQHYAFYQRPPMTGTQQSSSGISAGGSGQRCHGPVVGLSVPRVVGSCFAQGFAFQCFHCGYASNFVVTKMYNLNLHNRYNFFVCFVTPASPAKMEHLTQCSYCIRTLEVLLCL